MLPFIVVTVLSYPELHAAQDLVMHEVMVH